MLIQILKGTPTWVFVLFFALLAIGYLQSRPRTVTAARLAILPAAFIGFSLYGVVASFGPRPTELLAWASGIGASVLLGRAFKPGAGARWIDSSRSFHVPGSWIPLALMMAVFFARYAITARMAMRPALAHLPVFAILASLAYGLLSGMFLARALGILALRPAPVPHSVQSTLPAKEPPWNCKPSNDKNLLRSTDSSCSSPPAA